MVRTLVVAATRAEIAHVPSRYARAVVGLGKTAAAFGTARALGSLDPSAWTVVNIGTAGALHDHLEGLHLPGVVINHELSAAAIRALGYDPQERLEIPGGDDTVLATGDVFVTDPVLRAELARRADLVDMEGYAVAYACRVFGVPVRLIKHVSDSADESAHDWPAMVDRSARVLADWFTTHSML